MISNVKIKMTQEDRGIWWFVKNKSYHGVYTNCSVVRFNYFGKMIEISTFSDKSIVRSNCTKCNSPLSFEIRENGDLVNCDGRIIKSKSFCLKCYILKLRDLRNKRVITTDIANRLLKSKSNLHTIYPSEGEYYSRNYRRRNGMVY